MYGSVTSFWHSMHLCTPGVSLWIKKIVYVHFSYTLKKKKLSSKMSLWRLAQHVCKVRTHFKPRSSLLGKVRFLLPWFVFILPMLELDLWAVGLTVSGLVGTRLTYDLPGAEGHIVDPPLSEARIVTWGEKKTMVQWTESKKRNNNNSYVKDRTT